MRQEETPVGAATSGAASSGALDWQVSASVTREVARHAVVCALVVLLSLAGLVVAMPPGTNVSLGPDFGTSTDATLTVSSLSNAEVAPTSDELNTASEVVSKRLVAYGVKDAKVRVDDNALVANLHLVGDVQRLTEVTTRTGKFELVEVDRISDAEAIAKIRSAGAGTVLTPATYTALLTNDDLASVTAQAPSQDSSGQSSGYVLNFEFAGEGKRAFAEVTSKLSKTGGLLAFVVDGVVISASKVSSAMLEGKVSVSGGFSQFEAEQTAAVLSGGQLPVALASSGSATVSPAFGQLGLPIALLVVFAGMVAVVVLLAMRYRTLAGIVGVAMLSWLLLVMGGLALMSGAAIGYLDLPMYLGILVGLSSFVTWAFFAVARLEECARQAMGADASADEAVRHTFDVRIIALVSATILSLLSLVLAWPVALSHLLLGTSLGLVASLLAQAEASALLRLNALRWSSVPGLAWYSALSRPTSSAQAQPAAAQEAKKQRPKRAKNKASKPSISGAALIKARKAEAKASSGAHGGADAHE